MTINQDQQTKIKELISKGKEQGYLTYAEVNDHLPEGIVDSDQIEDIINMITEMGIVVQEQPPDEDSLSLSDDENQSTDDDAAEEAAQALVTVDQEFGRTTDPVRMYMREMGTVNLLTREGEISIAKRIEEGLNQVTHALAFYPNTIEKLLTSYALVIDQPEEEEDEDTEVERLKLSDLLNGFIDPEADNEVIASHTIKDPDSEDDEEEEEEVEVDTGIDPEEAKLHFDSLVKLFKKTNQPAVKSDPKKLLKAREKTADYFMRFRIVPVLLTELKHDLKQVVSNIPGYECYFKSSYYGGLAYVYNTNTIQINSKYEIFTSQPYWNAFPRSPQVLDCNFMGNNYIIINNHFKCCGDGTLNTNDTNDEENRRLQAVTYLKQYIDNTLLGKRVILLGDLNDEIIDNTANNVFQDFINDNTNYLFTDMFIAEGNSIDWSYPTWPSHLDHILITNELFADFQNFNSLVSVIRIDDYVGNWSNYENYISDHRPIGLKLDFGPASNILDKIDKENRVLKLFDLLGRDVFKQKNGFVVKLYDDGTVEKSIIIE